MSSISAFSDTFGTRRSISDFIKFDPELYDLVPNPSKTKSTVWHKFGYLKRKNDGKLIQNQVHCFNCKAPYSYSVGSPTTTLSRHKCYVVEETNKLPFFLYQKKGLLLLHEKKFLIFAVQWISSSGLPISCVENESLENLWQFVADVAGREGLFDVKLHIKKPQTITREIFQIAEMLKGKNKSALHSSHKPLCILLDGWDNSYNNRHS